MIANISDGKRKKEFVRSRYILVVEISCESESMPQIQKRGCIRNEKARNKQRIDGVLF
jgi:hypothetical protein